MYLHRNYEGGKLSVRRVRTCVLWGLLALFLVGCGDELIAAPGSPVSVTSRSLSERIEDHEAAQAALPVEEVEEIEEEDDEVDADPPKVLAFAEALESGELVAVNVVAGTTGAGLFAGPGDAHQRLDTLPSGRDVEATGTVTGEWALIVHDGVEGWLEADKLTLNDLPERDLILPEPELDETAPVYIVGGVGVNIRSQPDVDGRLLTSASSGDQLIATGNTSRHWVEVTYQGTTGWASGNFISPRS